MKLSSIILTSIFSVSIAYAGEGVVNLQSAKNHEATVNALKNIFDKKGITLFAEIDHKKGAASVGQELLPTTLLVFGNPKLGSPLMKCEQAVALDLPQKMLIKQDAEGKVWLSYNDPQYLKARHGVTECDEAFAKVSGALRKISSKAATSK